jgi:hypothetical protein
MLDRNIETDWGVLEAAIEEDGSLRFDIPSGKTLRIEGEPDGEVTATIDGEWAGSTRPLTREELDDLNDAFGLDDE